MKSSLSAPGAPPIYGTDVIANKLYYELFAANNLGHASAIAVVLLFTALPVALINIFQFRSEARA